MSLYPLQFEPLFKSAIWGGDRLFPLFGRSETDERIGEAWILSDQGENRTPILNGLYRGQSLCDLLDRDPQSILGYRPPAGSRFPLLLKIIDARQPLSVQVHPNDEQAISMAVERGQSTTDRGKTEAWVVLDKQPQSLIYAGLKEGTCADLMRSALSDDRVASLLHSYQPELGDCIFLEAGTVHAIGAGLMLFEVQQTSDITYRLYDWGRVDAKTGQPRTLHIDESLRCTNFHKGPCPPVQPTLDSTDGFRREQLVACDYFHLDRWTGSQPITLGRSGICTMIVCVEGEARLLNSESIEMKWGSVVLIPAAVGSVRIEPLSQVTLLEITIPISETV